MELTVHEAAHVLGVLRWRAEQILGPGPYELDTTEEAARIHYRFADHWEDPYSYWVNTREAARIYGVSAVRIRQLCQEGRIPHLLHDDDRGQYMMRRTQIEVLANAHEARRLGHRDAG